MSTVSGAALVGRADELQRLRDCCRVLAEGSGTLVLLDGDAGAGKTRLVAEVMKAPFLPRGYAAVSAGALDYARAPYAPIRDLLVALDKRFPKVLAGNAALASALRPVLEFRPLESSTADSGDQRRILDAVVAALEKYTAAGPIVLAVEDVHWIDRASADVLLHLSRRIADLRAVVLVSFRPAEAQQDEHVRYLVAQLSRDAAVSLSLKALPESDALLLIDDLARVNLSMNVRRRICQMAEGNPLLLVEYTKLACRSPDALHGGLPMNLKALVADRLARFDPVDVDVLRVAAELGQFDSKILADVAGASRERVLETLKKARRASIVDEHPFDAGMFSFQHALIRHAITDDLLGIEREELNRRIAERLEREAAGASVNSRLAHHFRLAREREKARRYSEAAAREAMRVCAFSDAVQFFEHAVDDRALEPDTYELYRTLGDAYALAQRPHDAVRVTELLLEYALERGDADAAGEFGFELSRRRYQVLDDDGAIETISHVLRRVEGAAQPRVLFNLHATLAWYLGVLWRAKEAAVALERATALREHGDPESLVRYHEACAHIKVHGGEAGSYRADVESALAIAQSLGPSILLRRLDNAIALSAASKLDDTEFTIELCGRVERVADESLGSSAAPSLVMAAWPLFLSGQLSRAYRALQPAFAYVEDAPLLAFFFAKAGIPLALHLEDALLLRRCARPRLLENAFASRTPNVYGPVAASIAMQLRHENRASEAIALLEQSLKRLPSASNNIPLCLEAARANASAILPRALDLLLEISGESRSALAAWHLCNAYVSRGELRREHARQAAEIFESIQWVLAQAEALELGGDTAAALDIYRAAGSVAGTRRLEARSTAQSNSALSKREWEVAGLVAEGKSNRSIAEDLVLSERTVENHIASIFAKLNVRSRAEVAAYVARSAPQQA